LIDCELRMRSLDEVNEGVPRSLDKFKISLIG
jgi:hypothetical protein